MFLIFFLKMNKRVPNRINPRQDTPRHILIKLTKIKHKEQILKAAREKEKTGGGGREWTGRVEVCVWLSTELAWEALSASCPDPQVLALTWVVGVLRI